MSNPCYLLAAIVGVFFDRYSESKLVFLITVPAMKLKYYFLTYNNKLRKELEGFDLTAVETMPRVYNGMGISRY